MLSTHQIKLVVNRQRLHQQGGKSGGGTTSTAVEKQETLEASSPVSLGTDEQTLTKHKKFSNVILRLKHTMRIG